MVKLTLQLLFILTVVSVSAFGQQRPKTNLIESDTPFSSNSTIKLEPDPLCATLRKTRDEWQKRANEVRYSKLIATRAAEAQKAVEECVNHRPKKIEIGSRNSVAYEFNYSDGSGTFAGTPSNSLRQPSERYETTNWDVNCEKDDITDEKTCYVDRGDVRLWVDSRGRSEIYIGANHYPGSKVVIRIDRTAPLAISERIFNGSFGYRASPAIISRITKAKTVTTRYQKWPYTDYVDETWDTYGLNEALAYIRWAVARIK